MKQITQFEIISHGIENSQYFQGCGVSFTKYTDVATGIGQSEKEALNDALESLAQNDWDVSTVEDSEDYINANDEVPKELEDQPEDSDCYFYVSVRVTDEADYSLMTGEDEAAILEEIVRSEGSNILQIGDVYTILREHFNNQILEIWAARHYAK